jgi:cation:H+ antiporter
MQEISLFVLAVIIGLVILTWSADRFVDGASNLAASFGVSPMIIGLTIVAFGTSAPEMLVSAMAAWQGNSGLAIGNAIGSNITNMTLVLGVAALIVPLTVRSQTLNREFPLMLVVMLAALVLLWNGILSRLDGLLLLTGMVILVLWSIHLARSAAPNDPLKAKIDAQAVEAQSPGSSWWPLLSGLLLLLVSSQALVWGAVGLAQMFGVSDLVIGLTIVAIGTSLPELAATVVAVRKGEHDMAVGGIVGSNLFNILAVLGIAAVIDPGVFDTAVLTRDFPLMIGLSVALYLMARGLRHYGTGNINRLEGALLLSIFIAYQLWIFLDAAPAFAL